MLPSTFTLERPRSANELRSWAAAEIDNIGRRPGGATVVRLRRGSAKQLVEEIYPLGLFAEAHFDASPNVWIKPVIGNQNYDAEIDDRRSVPGTVHRIEVTLAHEGEAEHLRMLYLEEHGHVSTLGTVGKLGTKKTGLQIKLRGGAQSHSSILAKELTLIEEAIARKLSKAYPSDTALVVMADDYIVLKDDADRDQLRALCAKYLPNAAKTFCLLAVVGWSGRLYEEFRLQPAVGVAP